MSSNYNLNLFELKKYESFAVQTYVAKLEPFPKKPAHFYQVLGRLAKRLTESMGTAVVSDGGKIKVLESTLSSEFLTSEVELENIDKFKVSLTFEKVESVGFDSDSLSYGRFVNKIVDLALCHLSNDYYKYSEMSPYIIERREGYFDKTLRERIGVEDGRRFYRGVRIAFGKPYLLLSREIELRSWKNLLNELKILAEWWGKRNEPVDFYNPPSEFVSFVNRAFKNRTANVIAYPSPSIIINGITWGSRASSKVLEGNISPIEYHKTAQGVTVKDKEQPLIRWTLIDKMTGLPKEQFHVPELLVVGHTFKDLKMRLLPSQVSQVFDILHPHCGDQQRMIYDILRKIHAILSDKFTAFYPSKLEFELFPADVSKAIEPAPAIEIRFGNRSMEITPPYGLTFYWKYTIKDKFAVPLSGVKKVTAFCKQEHKAFVETLLNETQARNECTLQIEYKQFSELLNEPNYDLAITVSDDEHVIKSAKNLLIGEYGIAHQNVTPEKATTDSIPQLAMQITLKLGGFPWLVSKNDYLKMISVYSYRNPFTDMRCLLFNAFALDGQMLYQSKPFESEHVDEFFESLKAVSSHYDRLAVVTSFWDESMEEKISEAIRDVPSVVFLKILQNNELQIFSTFKPALPTVPRRRTPTVTYACEAYENAPQGVILELSKNEYYILTTGSTKVGTYYRGCPTPIRVQLISIKGNFEIGKILSNILSLSFAAGVSGHGTRLPAPLYYLKAYAKYVNEYGLPKNEKVFQRIFYV